MDNYLGIIEINSHITEMRPSGELAWPIDKLTPQDTWSDRKGR